MHDDIVEVWITPKNNSNKVEMRIFYTENNMVQVEKFNIDHDKAKQLSLIHISEPTRP